VFTVAGAVVVLAGISLTARDRERATATETTGQSAE
jgi:hypothetical protein